jgi:hypothetical protein
LVLSACERGTPQHPGGAQWSLRVHLAQPVVGWSRLGVQPNCSSSLVSAPHHLLRSRRATPPRRRSLPCGLRIRCCDPTTAAPHRSEGVDRGSAVAALPLPPDLRDHNPNLRLQHPSCLSQRARDLRFLRNRGRSAGDRPCPCSTAVIRTQRGPGRVLDSFLEHVFVTLSQWGLGRTQTWAGRSRRRWSRYAELLGVDLAIIREAFKGVMRCKVLREHCGSFRRCTPQCRRGAHSRLG